jgi:hypothetical protein
VGTQLSWSPRPAPAAAGGLQGAGAIAAVVLGSILGLIMLLAAAALFVQLQRWRRQRRYGMVGGKEAGPSCWDACLGQHHQQQLLPPDGSSWAEARPSNGSSARGPLGASAAAVVPSHYFAGAYLVHTSPNSATTVKSFRGVGGDATAAAAAAAVAAGFIGHQQQQQCALEVEAAGPSYRPTSSVAGPVAGSLFAGAALSQGPEGTEATGADDTGAYRGVGGGQHKQQVFEAARRQLGATAGDLARSDALVLEAVLGEGSFGKVWKGMQGHDRWGAVVWCNPQYVCLCCHNVFSCRLLEGRNNCCSVALCILAEPVALGCPCS